MKEIKFNPPLDNISHKPFTFFFDDLDSLDLQGITEGIPITLGLMIDNDEIIFPEGLFFKTRDEGYHEMIVRENNNDGYDVIIQQVEMKQVYRNFSMMIFGESAVNQIIRCIQNGNISGIIGKVVLIKNKPKNNPDQI